jgi:hypothetical protein
VTLTNAGICSLVASYARRVHAIAGGRHHVASPLGAWLLLALCATASDGAARKSLNATLGCDCGDAASLAAALLASPHPLVPAAAAAWYGDGPATDAAGRWLAALPPCVTASPMPGLADLDDWARRHTFGLIGRFPGAPDPTLRLLVATVLATRVSWATPFDLAPVTALGPLSPWAGQLSQVLRTPGDPGHEQYVAAASVAGDVAVHTAWASGGGLSVTSVAAAPGVPASQVLAAAYDVATAGAAGREVARRSLFDLPLGDGPLWSVAERRAAVTSASGREEQCTAVLPAWSARIRLELAAPDLGFGTALSALAPGQPSDAVQVAVASYTRVGFEAAAITSAWAGSAPPQAREGVVRTAELRFGQPYAVVAVAADWSGRGPWHGLPVFSAWVEQPQDAGPM